MIWLFLGIGTIGTVEVFLRLPILSCLGDLRQLTSRVSATISSTAISDHWKERVLPKYAWQLFSTSVFLFAFCFLSVLPFVAVGSLASAFDLPIFDLVSTFEGIGVSTIFATAYVFLRTRLAR